MPTPSQIQALAHQFWLSQGDLCKEVSCLLGGGAQRNLGREEDGKLSLPWTSVLCHPNTSPDASLRNWGK